MLEREQATFSRKEGINFNTIQTTRDTAETFTDVCQMVFPLGSRFTFNLKLDKHITEFYTMLVVKCGPSEEC